MHSPASRWPWSIVCDGWGRHGGCPAEGIGEPLSPLSLFPPPPPHRALEGTLGPNIPQEKAINFTHHSASCQAATTPSLHPHGHWGFPPLLSCPRSFSLDKDTGLILLTARLDFETTQRYTLTVIARDGGGEETTGRVRINVLDVNDNVPTFQKEAYLGALRENEPSVTQVVRLRVRDRSGSSARDVRCGSGLHPPFLPRPS